MGFSQSQEIRNNLREAEIKGSSLNNTRASVVAQLVKNPPAMWEAPVPFLGQEDPWRKERLPTSVFMGFPGGSDGKGSAHSEEDLGSIPGWGRSPGGGRGNPLQCSCPMDRRTWPATVPGATKSQTGLSTQVQHSTLHTVAPQRSPSTRVECTNQETGKGERARQEEDR